MVFPPTYFLAPFLSKEHYSKFFVVEKKEPPKIPKIPKKGIWEKACSLLFPEEEPEEVS